MERFLDDDPGYREWLAKHLQGFIVDCYPQPSPNDLRLHQAHCECISGEPRNGRSWTGDYLKVCSENRTELERWAREVVGGESQPCQVCNPGSNRD